MLISKVSLLNIDLIFFNDIDNFRETDHGTNKNPEGKRYEEF